MYINVRNRPAHPSKYLYHAMLSQHKNIGSICLIETKKAHDTILSNVPAVSRPDLCSTAQWWKTTLIQKV